MLKLFVFFVFVTLQGLSVAQNAWEILDNITYPRPILDINFINPDSGWLLSNKQIDGVGNHSLLAKTTNGGIDWDTTLIYHIIANNFDFFSFDYGILPWNHLYLSKDGWQTFKRVYNEPVLDLLIMSAQFASDSVIYAAWRTVIKSIDSGKTWTDIKPPQLGVEPLSTLSILSVVNDSVVYCYQNSEKRIFRTTDSGKTWVTFFKPSFMLEYVFDIHFVSDYYGWIVGSFKKIGKTTDGGETWINQSPNTHGIYDTFVSIDALDENNAVVVGGLGSIYWTTNAGEQWWKRLNEYELGNLFVVDIVDENTAYVGGDSGLLFKTTTAGITNVKDQILPIEYKLNQNYPNPFNPSTKITYQLPKEAKVTLKVFDTLGKVVATLVDEVQYTGKYEINFDAEVLASGVYFYQLTTPDFSESKKMLLIR